MISKQIDSFFELPKVIYTEAKKTKLYKVEDHPDHIDKNHRNTWPGLRSEELGDVNPLFKYFIMKYLSLANLDVRDKNVRLYVHARYANDMVEDFIHTDTYKYSLLIYLSETNLNSGTKFFNLKDEVINDFKFIQNRLLFFDSRYRHTAYGHHGDSINNCRLTLNGFIK
tara:strand:+ start:5383 stop:5889 length:507 start_codon:yes stop_codon:yes gene_type:complete